MQIQTYLRGKMYGCNQNVEIIMSRQVIQHKGVLIYLRLIKLNLFCHPVIEKTNLIILIKHLIFIFNVMIRAKSPSIKE